LGLEESNVERQIEDCFGQMTHSYDAYFWFHNKDILAEQPLYRQDSQSHELKPVGYCRLIGHDEHRTTAQGMDSFSALF
jgi:hypothetical protein